MKQVSQITPEQAAALVKDGDIIFGGGFGMTGNPTHLLHALAKTQTKDLTYIGNNVGEPNLGGGKLLLNGQIKKMIGSFFTSNPDAVKAAQSGTVEYELCLREHWQKRSGPAEQVSVAFIHRHQPVL